MYVYLCICTEWMCGHVCMYRYICSHGVKSCFCWSQLDHGFHCGALLFHLDRRKRMSFLQELSVFIMIHPVGQAMACNKSGEFRILNSWALMHTHTVHSSMHTEERTQFLPLVELWLYSAFVQLQRDLRQQFYILDKCIWMLRSRSFVHLPVPFMLLFSAAR